MPPKDLSVFLEIAGLKPKAYLVLGKGFVREEWKSLCFKNGKSITQAAIHSANAFALSFVSEAMGRVLDQSARVELLRQSLQNPALQTDFPTLLAHRFRPQFYDALDRSLQKGRNLFLHAEEAKVLEERLIERLGFEGRREEFFLLNGYWEKILQIREFYDEARVWEEATVRIRQRSFHLPVNKIYQLEHFVDSPRTRLFWEALKNEVEIVKVHSSDLGILQADLLKKRALELIEAHSLEDAAHFLMDELMSKGDFNSQAIVIQDRPEVRRTLKRVAEERGIPLADPRDPTLMIQSEAVKSALLELEIVAKNFPAPLVLPWVSTFLPDSALLRKKIIELGITQGLSLYQSVPPVHSALLALKERYPSRVSLNELTATLEESIRKFGLEGWVSAALARVFSSWQSSLNLMGVGSRKRPLRFWLEQLQDKIQSSPPAVTPEKNLRGLKVYRVDQGISLELNDPNLKIHFFGVSPAFFEPREQNSGWFSAREIEVLSQEFQIPGREALAAQAKTAFLTWLNLSQKPARFWQYRHNEEGAETETLQLILRSIPEIEVVEVEAIPVHPQVLPSLSPKLKSPPTFIGVDIQRREFPMSFLSSLGNCAFTAYAQHLLGLFDEREPDFDLSGDSFGNLVHAAVELLVSSGLTLTPEAAFDQAWQRTVKIAWLKSDRLFTALRGKSLSILQSFLDSETEYQRRSGASLIEQEFNVKLQREGFTFSGRVDRIDQHADGIVLMDYKTGGALPSGSQTLELGKGLQLPAYALALKETFNQEVVSAQYIHLAPGKTNRNLGFLFAQWNKGKAADQVEFPLSSARGNSGSLVSQDPETIWKQLDEKMTSLLKQAKSGNFKPMPADPADCVRCRYILVCGRERALVVDVESP